MARSYVSEADLLAAVRAFAQDRLMQCAAQIDAQDGFPDGLVAELAQLRLLALDDLGDGGAALDVPARTRLLIAILEQLAQVSPAVAKHVMDQNFGAVGMLRTYGSAALKATYLPKIQAGELQLAFGMTEPQSGSDVHRFTTRATPTADGGVMLEGVKDWITGAASRQLHLVVAKAPASEEIGLFLVDRTQLAAGAVVCDGRKEKLGLRGLGEYRVTYAQVPVPAEHVVVPCGPHGLHKVMAQYDFKRCGQAAIALGLSRAALAAAYRYLAARHPMPHGRLAFETAEFACAEIYTQIQAAEQVTLWAGQALAAGDESGVPSSVAKITATEAAVAITNAAAQLCGANGLSDALPIARLMRDARMLTVAGGTTETMKLTIAKHLPKLLAASAGFA